MTNKKIASIVLGVVASIVFLIGSFYKVNFPDFISSFKKVNSYSVLFYVLLFGLSCVSRALIWRITTITTMKIGISTLFGGVVVGYMVNGILPFRAGELFRAQYLSSMTGFRRTAALSTVFIERFLDVLSLGLLLMLCLFFGIHGLSVKTALIVLSIWATITILVGLVIMNLESLLDMRDKLTFIPKRLMDLAAGFLSPLSQLRRMKTVVLLLVLSILVWTCNYLSLLALIYSSVPAKPYEAALLLFFFVNLGLLIPSAPGGLGITQLAFVVALSQFEVPKEQALALSFAGLFAVYIFNMGVGLPYFLRAHLKLNDFSQDSK